MLWENDFCEVWYIGSWFLQNFSRNLRLRFQKLKSVSISLWLSLGHFHQIIHFRYIICFEAFEFAQVVSSLLALKLEIKIEYFGSILNNSFDVRNSCIKTRSSIENPKTWIWKVWTRFVMGLKKIYKH